MTSPVAAAGLVVDGDDAIPGLVAFALRRADLKVLEARSGEAALDVVRTQTIGLVVLDMGLPGMSGTDIVQALRARAAADQSAAEAQAGAPLHRVLHIEDNLSNLQLIERIVARRPGIELISASQGQLGIDLARQHRPDLVLLDVHLPDMPGQEVLRRLQSYPETRDTPVVIISADATATQIRRLTEEGAAGYLTKPIDVMAFFELADSILGGSLGGR